MIKSIKISANASPLAIALCVAICAPVALSPKLLAAVPPDPPASAASELDAIVKDKRYLDLGAALGGKPRLSPTELDYFQGVLDSHTNAVESSTRLLDHILPTLRESKSSVRLVTALQALAEDYARRFEYERAANTYEALEKALNDAGGAGLSNGERRQIRDDAARYNLLRTQPPQAIGTDMASASDSVQGHRNPFGLLEVPIATADPSADPTDSWVVDTGSTLSVVTRSTAERLHLKLISGKATTEGVGGGEIPLQVAVIPSLRLGKTIIHNAAVVVFEDRALNIGDPPYQIQGILGLPILEALGRLTVGPKDQVTFGGPSAESGPPNLLIENFKPLVAAVTDAGPRLFTFDSGATDTVLTERYWREHKADLLNDPRIDYKFAGADGLKAVAARQAPSVGLEIGGAKVTLQKVAVLTDPAGKPGANAFFGNLGQDMLRPFASYTLDFRTMHFSLTP